MEEDEIISYKSIIYIPNVADLKKIVMDEIHQTPYSGHMGYEKIIATTRRKYFWLGMKNDIVEYISNCMKCQR